MFNHPGLRVAVYLIAATTVGIVSATNKEAETAAADEQMSSLPSADEYPNSPAFPLNYDTYPNGTGSRAMFYKLPVTVDPPPIENSRTPPGVPCGVSSYQCSCPNSPYRTSDGTCNNLVFTGRGSVGSPFSRLQRGRYADANGKMKTHGLPSARYLSYRLLKDVNVPEPRITNILVLWGQVVAHDSSLRVPRTGPRGQPIQCCTNYGQMKRDYDINCCAIEIPKDDPFYSQFNRGCMDMVRSEILDTTGCNNPDILPISMVNHYQDISIVYGNSDEQMNSLRTFIRGQMKAKYLPGNEGKPRMFLPEACNPTQNCFVQSNKEPCYKAGDSRVNENLGLASFQTILLREHNRLAKILHKMHNDWDDETLFQEARRINIAEWQYVTFNDFLPKIIGEALMEKLHLSSPEEGFTNFYSPQVDVSTMNEYTVAAYRYLHTMIQGDFELTNEARCPYKSLWLRDYYMKPGVIEKKDNLDALFRGMATQPSQSADTYFSYDITQFLMRNKLPFGDDLESIDIERGRDHGLPSYNDMRFYCGLPRANHFEDLLDVIPAKYVNHLKALYPSVDHIDFFVGGSLEYSGVSGDYKALVGPTFGCVIGEQFWRWKIGDRHFFDLANQAGSFTLEQINGIKKASLSSLLCDNLNLKYIQKDAFLQVYKGNELKHCEDIERMDLTGWINYTPNYTCWGGEGGGPVAT